MTEFENGMVEFLSVFGLFFLPIVALVVASFFGSEPPKQLDLFRDQDDVDDVDDVDAMVARLIAWPRAKRTQEGS